MGSLQKKRSTSLERWLTPLSQETLEACGGTLPAGAALRCWWLLKVVVEPVWGFPVDTQVSKGLLSPVPSLRSGV